MLLSEPAMAHIDHARGLFDHNGMFFRVNRESALLIGGGAALLMQVAHPKIAAAVAEHSQFREQPLKRLYRTVRAMQDIVFGDRATALATAARIRDIHARVYGRLPESTQAFAQGTDYSAQDPKLVLWVYATLIETMMRTYSAVVRPLTKVEAESFYAESRTIAALFGAPDELIPQTLDEFRRYFASMLDGTELKLSATARAIADDIIHPPITGLPDRLGDLISVPALALLPETLRESYGFKWGRKRRLAWKLARRAIHEALPYAPQVARVSSRARRAERRVIAANSLSVVSSRD
jgi:uncharacterized protein (DUF2236 family)